MITDSHSGMPALCAELNLRSDAGTPLANSRDVAEVFEKRHGDVLRDIDNLINSTDANLRWFRASAYLDAKGEERRSFDLTRDGFTLLAMGWTGERAMTFKVRYIQAFNAMEAELRSTSPVSTDQLIQAVREIVAPLAVRHDGHDRAIERVETRIDGIADDLASVKARVLGGRRNLTAETKRDHVEATRALGGKCPCCRRNDVVNDQGKLPFSEFDHFYQNSRPSADHTWLICKPCHTELSSGRVSRDQREAEFRAYQGQRRRLPGRQPSLF